MEKEEPITSETFDRISTLLFNQTGKNQWRENPKLYFILRQISQENLFQKLLDDHVTDLWLPVPRHIVRGMGLEENDTKSFLKAQELCLDNEIPTNLKGEHLSLMDSGCMGLKEVRMLGSGGYGSVHHVVDPRTETSYARKVMFRLTNFKRHCEAMQRFKKELEGMRRVRHRHCVDLIATCTDMDSVILLSSPVADMDLAKFLDSDLNPFQLNILRSAVGCITSALAYLHQLNIRHDDLKTNNILIHGSNILLTDFGFCLDFSDSAISTTVGAPKHFSRRYSAPEVFGHEPRNRLTDIWGLGCVLFEVLSRLHGYKLHTMTDFWRSNGTRQDSFAQNSVATAAWYATLTRNQAKSQHGTNRRDLWLISFIYHVLLQQDRLLRPTAEQVFDRLQDLDALYPVNSSQFWVAACCATQLGSSTTSISFHLDIPQWPMLDLMMTDDHLAYLFLDKDLEVFATSKNLSFLDHVNAPGALKLGRLIAAETEIQRIQSVARSMMESVSSHNHRIAESNTILAQTMNSTFACSLRDTKFWVDFLNIYLENDEIPRVRTVQLSLQIICLERQPSYSAPFLVLTFDPNEGEVARAYDPKQGKIADFSYREGRDVWTDGLSVAARLFEGEKREKYAQFNTCVSERQRKFVGLLNERRTIKKGFAKAKCFRCTQLALPCNGLQVGGCYQCRASHSYCKFSAEAIEQGGETMKYIDNRAHADALAATRWAS